MSEHTAPSIPPLQGKLPGRLGMFLQAMQEKEASLDSFEPRKSFLETMLTPPRVQTEGDILDILSATIGLPGTAGIAQAIGRGAKGIGRAPAGVVAANVPPRKGGGEATDFLLRRNDQLDMQEEAIRVVRARAIKETLQVRDILDAIPDVLSAIRKRPRGNVSSIAEVKARQRLSELELPFPGIGKPVDMKSLDAKQLKSLEAQFKALDTAITESVDDLAREFAKLQTARTRVNLSRKPK